VENSRGKKGKKAIWHLTLGLKDTIFAGIGVVGLMMMSFALGALAGRGDIYRVAYSWGLWAPENAKVAQLVPPPAATASSQGAAPGAQPAAAAAPAPAEAPGPAAAAPPKQGAPVTGSIAELPPSPAGAKKKAKSASGSRDHKAKEEEIHQLRQEVAKKLKFQNSFDTAPKTAKQKPKEKEAKAKTAVAPTQVKVAQFRDAKAAKAKVAELQKKGIKTTLKQGKDGKGAYYTVYRQSAAKPQGNDKVAQKTEKPGDSKPKPSTH
jgi:hypothetical protein